MLLQRWLSAHLDQFDHTFAAVDLNDAVDVGAFSWLRPTAVSYAYLDRGKSDGALGILCMTEGRSCESLPPQLSPFALAQQPTLSISGRRMLEKLILPNLPNIYMGARQDDFELSDSDPSIRLKHDSVDIRIRDKDGKSHECQLKAFELTVDGGVMTFHAKTSVCEIMGITQLIEVTSKLQLKVVNTADGLQSLQYEEVGDPIIVKTHNTPLGLEVVELVLSLLAALGLLIVAFLTDGIALLIVAMVAGLAGGALVMVRLYVENEECAPNPDIAGLVTNAAAPVKWSAGAIF